MLLLLLLHSVHNCNCIVQLGTLPPQFFTVTISTVGENMSQLMLSVLMTGYMFRNAQYRCAQKATSMLSNSCSSKQGNEDVAQGHNM
jgi:hypothetical protein